MPCNIQSQRRRKKWQNNQAENSPCECDVGFAKAGCVARQWWIRWDEAQLDDKWLWLNAGYVLTFGGDFPLGGCLYVVAPTATQAIELELFASDVPFENPDFGTITVRAEVRVRTDILFPLPTSTFVDVAGDGIFRPEPTSTFALGLWTTLVPVPGLPSTIVGQAFITPLKPCHNCT